MNKTPFYALALLAYLIGTINGIGYSIYIGQWPTAICVAVLSAMAFPTAKKFFKAIIE